jgi:HK97 family phage prohead protease
MADEKTLDVETKRDIPALSMRAEFRPGSVNDDDRTAEVVWTTGARVKRGFWDAYWEELSLDPKHVRMDRLNNGAPLLSGHDAGSLDCVLGVVESARLDKTKGVATVRFAKAEANPEAEKAFRMVKDGILQNISVGYRVHKLEQVEDARARDDKTPVLLATDWEPYELSVVPMGADDGAGFRAHDEKSVNPCVVITREEQSMSEKNEKGAAAAAADPTDQLVATAKAENARAAAESDKVAREAADRAAVEARERITETMKLVRKTNLGDAFAEKLIKANTPLDKVREIVLRELTENQGEIDGHLRVEAGDDARAKFIRGASASIFERAGHSQMIERAKKNERVGHLIKDVALDGGEFRGMSLLDLARHSLEMRGVSTKSLHGDRLVRRAFEYRDPGMNTAGDFPVLLESVVNKVFLGQYAIVPVTWPEWCGKKSVQDFRTTTFYRPGTFGTLDAVTEAGEIKHKNIPDGAKATMTPTTKGNIIGLSRRAIVNDDLGAFRDLAAGLGMAAAFSVEADAYALLTAAAGLGANAPDGVALFNAAHGNIGSTGAMSVTTLDSIRAKMALQRDAGSVVFLNLRPSVLLVPVELGGQAKVFNESAADPTDSKNSQVPNRVRGLFSKVIDSPYLSASGATRHYAFADPGLYPACAVGFIDGSEAPRIESHQSFEYDGIQMRVILDYGTAVLDHRPTATCAGQ